MTEPRRTRSQYALVTGAGGFIGGHLVQRLVDEGYHVFAVDIKPMDDWWQTSLDAANYQMAARDMQPWVVERADEVYHLAANMGGIGFITNHLVACAHNIRDTLHVLNCARHGQRVFYSSSACVYPSFLQDQANGTVAFGLREHDAVPADPEPGYGWEKLYGEHVAWCYAQERGVATRVARYHNIYGPFGSWCDGREKAPAALCRKVAIAKLTGDLDIDIWGDGEQTRSFTYIDDCLEGTVRLARSEVDEPLNIGSHRIVTINELLTMVEDVAGIKLHRHYNLDAPQGVRGRNSDNTLIKARLDWEPSIDLETGLVPTYEWIYNQVAASY